MSVMHWLQVYGIFVLVHDCVRLSSEHRRCFINSVNYRWLNKLTYVHKLLSRHCFCVKYTKLLDLIITLIKPKFSLHPAPVFHSLPTKCPRKYCIFIFIANLTHVEDCDFSSSDRHSRTRSIDLTMPVLSLCSLYRPKLKEFSPINVYFDRLFVCLFSIDFYNK